MNQIRDIEYVDCGNCGYTVDIESTIECQVCGKILCEDCNCEECDGDD